MMQRVFLTDRYPGWYVSMVEDGVEMTFGPFSEAECETLMARIEKDDLDHTEALESARCVIMVRLEGEKWPE